MVLGVILMVGCSQFGDLHTAQLSSEGVWSVFVDDDAGDIIYDGSASGEVFDLSVTSWGKGNSGGRAEARASHNTWGAMVSGDLLDVWGRSGLPRSGVDVEIVGPSVIDVEAITLDGTVGLYNVDGWHTVTANRVVGDQIFGDVDLYASRSGIDVEVIPYQGSVVRVESDGDDVVLALPYGLPYDLEVWGDYDWGGEVDDLGFDSVYLAPDYVSAYTGGGSIKVEVYVRGGSFYVVEAL